MHRTTAIDIHRCRPNVSNGYISGKSCLVITEFTIKTKLLMNCTIKHYLGQLSSLSAARWLSDKCCSLQQH